jgi:GWxTD domain-containing protein
MKKYFLSILIAAFLFTNASAQYLASSKMSGIGVPFFQTGIFRTFQESVEDSLRLVRIYFQIINDDLTFLKQEDNYQADVEFDIYITNKSKEFVFNRTVNKQIKTAQYEETNSRQLANTFYTDITLKPDNYDLIITALDKNNNKQVNRKINFELDDLREKKFLISDILFFQNFQLDSSNQISSFEPNLTNNFSGQGKNFYFYFASIVSDPQDTLRVKYMIRNPEGNMVQFNQYILVNNKNINENYIRINRQLFDQSRYELEVTASYKNQTIKTKKIFSFYWTDNPDSPKDLTNALDQMRYIVEADSVGWALKQNYDEKLGYFKRFWKRVDPNPETEKNELMDEYYLRVNTANQNFSTLSQDGWLTDRGRIFIKFGEPDDIERHPFEINSQPYEIWRYYGLRKVFLFIDRTSFGDYYLHPNYLDEEFN